MKKKRRTFSPEFKLQMVQLFKNGKSRKDIIREYNLTPSALDIPMFLQSKKRLSNLRLPNLKNGIRPLWQRALI